MSANEKIIEVKNESVVQMLTVVKNIHKELSSVFADVCLAKNKVNQASSVSNFFSGEKKSHYAMTTPALGELIRSSNAVEANLLSYAFLDNGEEDACVAMNDYAKEFTELLSDKKMVETLKKVGAKEVVENSRKAIDSIVPEHNAKRAVNSR